MCRQGTARAARVPRGRRCILPFNGAGKWAKLCKRTYRLFVDSPFAAIFHARNFAPRCVSSRRSSQLAKIGEMRAAVGKAHPHPVPAFPELTGDLRLLRFLEGYGMDVGAASEAYVGMLTWRARNGMDTVRDRLVADWDDDLHR